MQSGSVALFNFVEYTISTTSEKIKLSCENLETVLLVKGKGTLVLSIEETEQKKQFNAWDLCKQYSPR